MLGIRAIGIAVLLILTFPKVVLANGLDALYVASSSDHLLDLQPGFHEVFIEVGNRGDTAILVPLVVLTYLNEAGSVLSIERELPHQRVLAAAGRSTLSIVSQPPSGWTRYRISIQETDGLLDMGPGVRRTDLMVDDVQWMRDDRDIVISGRMTNTTGKVARDVKIDIGLHRAPDDVIVDSHVVRPFGDEEIAAGRSARFEIRSHGTAARVLGPMTLGWWTEAWTE